MLLNQKIGRFIDAMIATDLPGMIVSTPGIGKTSTIELYCKVMDINLTTLIASQYASDDILGIQSVSNGKLIRVAPSWYDELMDKASNGKRNLLFIDELTTCDEFIQAPLLNLIFNKSLGGHRLPDNTTIIAAGNYKECLNNAFEMTMPLINRFILCNIFESDVDYQELVTTKFVDIKSSNDQAAIKEFLGLEKKDTITPKQFGGLARLIISNKKVNIEVENSIETGMIGFTSVRSLNNSLKYLNYELTNGYSYQDVYEVIDWTLGPGVSKHSGIIIQYLKKLSEDNESLNTSEIDKLDFTSLIDYMKVLIKDPSKVNYSVYKAIEKNVTKLQKTFIPQEDSKQLQEVFVELRKVVTTKYES